MHTSPEQNLDEEVARGFGDEWSRFDQTALSEEDRAQIWQDYFHLFPFEEVRNGRGADIGCGSGRWAGLVAPRVAHLLCVDASEAAVAVARKNLEAFPNVSVTQASVEALPVRDESLDFAYSLGVLHHVPNTEAAIRSVADKLKPGAPLLLYLYYDFENRSRSYRALWRASEILRAAISRAPYGARYTVSQALAGTVYLPLARLARTGETLGLDVSGWPLSFYRDKGFYVMRTDALDRFGTRLEQRFSRARITEMLVNAGMSVPRFSTRPPFWTCLSKKVPDEADEGFKG